MKRTVLYRAFSFFLAVVLTMTLVPPVYAASDVTEPEIIETVAPTEAVQETTAEAEPETTAAAETEAQETAAATEAQEQTESPEETEATEVTEAVEETAPVEETAAATEATEATEAVEETEAAEQTEVTEVTEAEEETEPAEEIVTGIVGLPEDYVLTQEQIEEKQIMAEQGVVATVAGLIPGENYAEDRIMIVAETEEFAQMAATAFGGSVMRCEYGMAVIRLQGVTVLEAVTAAADMEQNLPAAYPDYIYRVEPVVTEAPMDLSKAAELPELQSWESWVRENGVNDPFLTDPYAEEFQWMHGMVNTYEAWGVTTGDRDVKVAVLDTGVQANHPDLNGKVTTYDIGCGTSDCDGHGTHVAGIIAATMGNGIGGAGIAPGVSILGIRVFEDADGAYYSDTIAGINKAVSAGAWIINMSMGGYFYNYTYERAVKNALNSGVTMVISMGNDGSNTYCYPVGYDERVIAVSAVYPDGTRTVFSNFGSWADVAAPGSYIWSTLVGSTYDSMSGTSQAAPVVAGVAALYMSAYGYTPPEEMQKILKASVSKAGSSNIGTGIIDAAKMFDGNKAMPDYQISGYGYNTYDSAKLTCESELYLYKPVDDDTGVILYTTDGKTPSTKNGEIVNGTIYTGAIDLSPFSGKTVTVKAAYVSGMGIVNKVRTLKLKVAESAQVQSITITGPNSVVSGKKATYTATVSPDKCDQDVIWSISRCDRTLVATITKDGVLKSTAGTQGNVTIRATSVAKPTVYKEFTAYVGNRNPIKTVTLSASSLTVNVNSTQRVTFTMTDTAGIVYPMLNSSGGINYTRPWLFTSSNPEVASVDNAGYIYGRKPGKTTITCKATDGSGKSAKCTVVVKQPMTWLSIEGQYSIKTGTSAKYKINAYPENVSNKKVTWSVSYAYGVSVNSSTGVVKVASYATPGSTFTLTATAADGSGVQNSITVKIASEKTSYVAAGYLSDYAGDRAKTNKNGFMTSLQLFSVEREDGIYYDGGKTTDTRAWVGAYASVGITVDWTSSKPEVADVIFIDGQAVVEAYSAGTTKITCKALDGSGKKNTFTVKVVNPVSTMTIKTSANRGNYNWTPTLAFGKSATNSVVFADTYGKPGITKVTWDFIVEEYDGDGDYRHNWTSYFKERKWVTISSSGKLSVKVPDYWVYSDGVIKITVIATATDGTGAQAFLEYNTFPPTKVLKTATKNWYIYSDNTIWYVPITCDQWKMFQNEYNCAFTATSSNPKVASVVAIEPAGGDLYYVALSSPVAGTKGTAKITIKSADNAKSLSFNVKVYP